MKPLWHVQIVSDADKRDGTCGSTPWLVSQVVRLWADLVQVHEEAEEYFRLQVGSTQMWRTYLETRLLHDPDARIIVALEDNLVLGFLVVRMEYPTPMFDGETYGFISDSVVRPEVRKQGIATALFHAAVRWLATRGIYHIELDVYNRNQVAWDYWTKKGFRPLKTRLVWDSRGKMPGDENQNA